MHRLIDEQDVGLGVPRPPVEVRRVGVVRDEARAILTKGTLHGGRARTTVQPKGERCLLRVLARFEEPACQDDEIIPTWYKEIRVRY